jgi:hypothetical protein
MGSSERAAPAEPTADASSATGSSTACTSAAAGPARAGARVGSGQHQEASGPSSAEGTVDPRVNCLMNARYHASREAFLDTAHRWFMFAIIAMGATAIIDVAPADWLPLVKNVSAAIGALLAAMDLTFDLSNRARAHSLMKRRYFDLVADLAEGSKTPEQVAVCASRYAADEEPAYHALLMASWNAAQEMVYGDVAYHYVIPRTHLFWKNIWRYPAEKYDLTKSKGTGLPA